MLIRHCEIHGDTLSDLRIEGGAITDIGDQIHPRSGEEVLDAAGGALLPGLHDHHIHLLALAAALDSIPCGPPRVSTPEQLTLALTQAAAEAPEDGWLRGIGYHESVAGDIDRHWLDRVVPHRPLRIQHRSGRLWILNSRALQDLGADIPAKFTEDLARGRLHDADAWLRRRLGSRPPSLERVGKLLASHGITGVTDTSQHNGPEELAHFAAEQARGHLPQAVLLMGDARLDGAIAQGDVTPGHYKIHLHEADLPPFDDLCADIRRSHQTGRRVAIHCVTLTELVFASAALEAAGVLPGDRIEHGAVAPPDTLPRLAALGLTVVTQPNFVLERGDAYLRDVDKADLPWLYRARGLLEAGILLAAGSDAPYGNPNPWLSMEAAVCRRTAAGLSLGTEEALNPEQTLALFTGTADNPGGPSRPIEIGAPADLCLLDRPWRNARPRLGAVVVRGTWRQGRRLWNAEES
ncbi:amidohydrolase family protein [Denitratisoma oestradiolicum]|uniref:Hydrolase n=1 Tax=Denitratisoma oestradiolicum TaxID=311182 RepID=A0A6S6Y1W7_9PROT|nr:amidohydrolase family protein [Denitratisoma oestradiolicum]TWO80211.1 hypothetical protein CBW56_10355 [Denitratisoma oestradiolicum]CAB1369293.1 Hydrolase [Denitratisoma oestradiolicum]